MNIWAWVNATERRLREEGNARLAHLMDRLPTVVCNNEHAAVDALYPEALALAKASGNPWLELFVRHWNLQSRILHRMDVGEWTGEAVSLIEFASREETKDCPQAICVTQDLVNAYGKVDGPGFTEERVAATSETLARIDAKWPCFRCISAEKAEALLDAGRADEALAFVEAQTEAMRAAGRPNVRAKLGDSRFEALFHLGRVREALEEVEANLPFSTDENERLRRRILKARALVELGAEDPGLPRFEEAFETPSFYREWADAAFRVARPSGGSWTLEAQLRRMQRRLVAQGVRRDAIQIALWRGELAVRRGAMHTAQDAADSIEPLIPELHRPLDAPALHQELRDQIVPVEVEAPVSAQAAIESSDGDPEADVPVLAAALGEWPDDEALVMRLASALRALGRPEVAERRLRRYLRDHPGAVEVFASLASALLDQGDHEGVEALVAEVLAGDPEPALAGRAHWMRGHSRRARDPAAARADYARVIELDPPANNAEVLLASLEREAGALESALARLDRVCGRIDEAGNWDWDRMVVGTLLERWDSVRDSARRLDFELTGEGRLTFAGGLCRIQFKDELEPQVLYARRTGPVTATILSISAPELPLHYEDDVVFDAAPINEGPAPGEEADHTWVYPLVAVLKPGGYRNFVVDGVHPQPFQLELLEMSMRGLGCVFSKRSGERYQITDPDTGESLLGLYAFLAIPERVPVAVVHEALSDIVAPFAHPLTWLTLAEAAGDEAAVEAQLAQYRRYAL